MTKTPQVHFSLFYKYFVNLKPFMLVIVKQCISFSNPHYFCISLSLPRALSSYYYYGLFGSLEREGSRGE